MKLYQMNSKLYRLQNNIESLGSLAVAYSGGVDSSFLLYVAHQVLGDNCLAITVCGNTLSSDELKDSKDFCDKYKINQTIIDVNELVIDEFRNNTVDRCYYCKKNIFEHIIEVAKKHNILNISDGSNLDDKGDYRPGMKALRQLGILSLLMDAEMTKDEIRKLSGEFNLPTWDKPALACLATRIPYGEEITIEKLKRIEVAESALRKKGFHNIRVRSHGDVARLEVEERDFTRVFEDRKQIVSDLKAAGYAYITLDLIGFRSGSMNETLDIQPSL